MWTIHNATLGLGLGIAVGVGFGFGIGVGVGFGLGVGVGVGLKRLQSGSQWGRTGGDSTLQDGHCRRSVVGFRLSGSEAVGRWGTEGQAVADGAAVAERVADGDDGLPCTPSNSPPLLHDTRSVSTHNALRRGGEDTPWDR